MSDDAVTITGLSEVQAKFNALDAKVAKSILRKGLRAGAKVALTAARAAAPRITGALADNLKVRGSRGKNGAIALKVAGSGRDFKGGKAWYTDWVIDGWRAGPAKLGDKRKLIPGNPFIDRAFNESKEAAVSATAEAWKTLIQQAAQEGK